MLTIEKLKDFGAEVDDGLARCLGKEDFYFNLIKMSVESDSFEKLKNALESGAFTAAFEEAHKLIGVLGNLSLTPIYKPVEDLTELLRPCKPCDYQALLDEILEKRAELTALMQ